MLKKLLLFSLYYFYCTDQWANGNDALQRKLDEFLRNTVQISDDGKPIYEFAISLSNKSNRRKRETVSIDFIANGQRVKILISPLERNVISRTLEGWTIKTNYTTKSINLTTIDKSLITLDGEFYYSIEPRGVFYVTNFNNTKQYYGVYGEGKDQRVIEPLPNSLQYVSITNFSDHIVHPENLTKPTDVIISVPETTTVLIENLKGQKNRTTPLKNFYPKLLLLVDGNYYTKFNKDAFKVFRYLSVFWNIVGLRYMEVPSPKIELIITGVIIATDVQTLTNVLIKPSKLKRTHINATFLFTEYDSWVKKEIEKKLPFKNYDSTFLMTPYRGDLNGTEVLGLSPNYLICYNTITYICDFNLNFGAVNIAVHELGHSMGLEHDNKEFLENSTKKTFLYPEDGLYLSWSTMSVKTFEIFAQKQIANCLGNSVKT